MLKVTSSLFTPLCSTHVSRMGSSVALLCICMPRLLETKVSEILSANRQLALMALNRNLQHLSWKHLMQLWKKQMTAFTAYAQVLVQWQTLALNSHYCHTTVISNSYNWWKENIESFNDAIFVISANFCDIRETFLTSEDIYNENGIACPLKEARLYLN